jgi:hypothetical protein
MSGDPSAPSARTDDGRSPFDQKPGGPVDGEPILRKGLLHFSYRLKVFDLQEVCYDPWNFRQMLDRMQNIGIICVEVRQGYATLSLATKEFLAAVAGGRFYHGGHPLMKWNASCLSTQESNDNMMFKKPERSKSSLRIDGITATTNALVRAMLDESELDHTWDIDNWSLLLDFKILLRTFPVVLFGKGAR